MCLPAPIPPTPPREASHRGAWPTGTLRGTQATGTEGSMSSLAARNRWLLVALLLPGAWLGPPGRARGQEGQESPAVADLQRRLRELEETVQRLQEEKGGETADRAPARPDPRGGTSPDEKEVRKLVNNYLKEKDEKKKKDDEKKKKEDDRKKKGDEEKKKAEEARGVAVGSDLSFKDAWKDGLNAETKN